MNDERNALFGWTWIAVGLCFGLVLGLWSFDGPLPSPPGLEEYGSLEELFQIQRKKWEFISDEVLRRRLTYETKTLPNGKVGFRYDLEIRQQWREDRLPANADLWPVIANITCPTLIVRATETDTLPLDVAQRIVEVIPNARLVHVEQASHMVMEDNPQGFLEAVVEFLVGG